VTCGRSVDFSPVSSTNKTDHHDITEILLKVALNTINQTIKDNSYLALFFTELVKTKITK
jgi:hypothetical protein